MGNPLFSSLYRGEELNDGGWAEVCWFSLGFWKTLLEGFWKVGWPKSLYCSVCGRVFFVYFSSVLSWNGISPAILTYTDFKIRARCLHIAQVSSDKAHAIEL